MTKKRARSGGVRNPVRNAALFGIATVASIALVLLGVADMRETGRTGSPLLALGLPALICPIFFFHYLHKIRVFRDMRSGKSAIARWTVPPGQFDRFREEQQRIPAASIMTNFYKPPNITPVDGVEVIFSDDGVLIGGGYFPLSPNGGRRLESVCYLDADPALIEFGTVMTTMARTSSATIETTRTAQTLRVPVAADATQQAGEVASRFQAIIHRR